MIKEARQAVEENVAAFINHLYVISSVLNPIGQSELARIARYLLNQILAEVDILEVLYRGKHIVIGFVRLLSCVLKSVSFQFSLQLLLDVIIFFDHLPEGLPPSYHTILIDYELTGLSEAT